MTQPAVLKLEEKVGMFLKQKNWFISTAESCTGGLIGHRLTNIAGSSEYFLGGIIAYSNSVKTKLLGVTDNILSEFGAVSQQTVIQMAIGSRILLGSDISISVSGIAGPGGGLPGKPVGTTWFGLSTNEGNWSRPFLFQGDRKDNKFMSSNAALEFVIDYFEGRV